MKVRLIGQVIQETRLVFREMRPGISKTILITPGMSPGTVEMRLENEIIRLIIEIIKLENTDT